MLQGFIQNLTRSLALTKGPAGHATEISNGAEGTGFTTRTTRQSTRGKLGRAKRVLAFGVADLTITLVVGQYREAALHRGPRGDFVIPAFDGWVLVQVDAAAFGETNT